MSEPLDTDAVTPEPEQTGIGVTGTTTVTPAPGSDSTALAAPDEGLGYVDRAASALIQALGTVPDTVEVSTEMLDALTLLVLVKGDRCVSSDVHDALSVLRRRDGGFEDAAPFDVLDPRERQGFDRYAVAVQKAGRFMGRDGS